MSTHFFDIDGTIVNYHTNDWIPGAKEYIKKLSDDGCQIVFITMRDECRDKNEVWSVENTRKILQELEDLNIKFTVLFNISSPRIIHDDSLVVLDQRRMNQPYF
jgi:histidinol phosphatase-like enzyme